MAGMQGFFVEKRGFQVIIPAFCQRACFSSERKKVLICEYKKNDGNFKTKKRFHRYLSNYVYRATKQVVKNS
jgi:hypothetical protein